MRHKHFAARALTLTAALAIAAGTNCVTALAAPAVNVVTNGQQGSKGSLYITLSSEQHNRLLTATGNSVAFGDNGTISLDLSAEQLDIGSVTLPKEVTAAKPVMVGKLTMSWQPEGGSKTEISRLKEPVQITVMLPTELEGRGYSIVCFDGSSYTAAGDMDNIANIVTFETTAIDRFVVTRDEVTGSKPAEPAPKSTEPPKLTDGVNPLAGGVTESYLPRSVMAQAVPISMPISVAPMQQGFSGNMAATSMLMTAAFVSGTIDYENSCQGEEDEEQPEPVEQESEYFFDEDSEGGIEEETEAFREVNYR